jgi:hypothetical protein
LRGRGVEFGLEIFTITFLGPEALGGTAAIVFLLDSRTVSVLALPMICFMLFIGSTVQNQNYNNKYFQALKINTSS